MRHERLCTRIETCIKNSAGRRSCRDIRKKVKDNREQELEMLLNQLKGHMESGISPYGKERPLGHVTRIEQRGRSGVNRAHLRKRKSGAITFPVAEITRIQGTDTGRTEVLFLKKISANCFIVSFITFW